MFIIEKGYRFYTVGKKKSVSSWSKSIANRRRRIQIPLLRRCTTRGVKSANLSGRFRSISFRHTERACVRDPSIIPNRQQYRALAVSAVGGRRRRRSNPARARWLAAAGGRAGREGDAACVVQCRSRTEVYTRTSAGELGGGEAGGGDEQRDELPQREAQQRLPPHPPPRAACCSTLVRRRH